MRIRKRWALRDYDVNAGECFSETRFWTRRGAEQIARWHRVFTKYPPSMYALKVERLPRT